MSRPAAAIALLLLGPARSEASYHLAHISEVMSGVAGDPSVQYVEIRMDFDFQKMVGNTRLTVFDCAGTTATVLLTIPPPTISGGDVPNQGAGRHWIMGTSSIATKTTPSVTPDFTFPPGIPAACGMVCWGGPVDPVTSFSKDPSTWDATDPNEYVDCVAYGPYAGPQKTDADAPATATPGEGVHSLVRQTNASNDFALACPTPTNNGPLEGAEVTGSFGACTEPTTTTTLRATTTTRPRATTTTTTVPAGTDRPLSGKKLVLKDNPSNPARRKLMVLSIDAVIELGPGNGSPDDPTLGGGSLRVRTGGGCGPSGLTPCDSTYSLPASAWRRVGKRPDKGYRYSDPTQANGPIRVVVLKNAKPHQLKAMGAGAELTHSLAGSPRPVDVVLTTGIKRYCMTFDGVQTFKPGKSFFTAKSPAPPACPP